MANDKEEKKEEKKADKTEEKAKKELTPEEEAAKSKKKKLLIMIIAGVLLLAGVGVGAGLFLAKGDGKKPETKASEGEKEGGDHAKEGEGHSADPAKKGDAGHDAKKEGAGHDAKKEGAGHDAKKEDAGHDAKKEDAGHDAKKGGDAKAAGKDGKKEGPTLPEGVEVGKIVELKPFHLNLGNPLENHYIRLEIGLEAKSDNTAAEITARNAQIRDVIIGVASKKTREFLLGTDGKMQLRKEIKTRINEIMKYEIENVYITDIIIE